MCLARVLRRCGIYAMPSLADGHIDIDHTYDDTIKALYKKTKISYSHTPSPDIEMKIRNGLKPDVYTTMLKRNHLLLSRLFIRNAKRKAIQLADFLKTKKKIRILDVGCGEAPTLLGMLAYFGVDHIEYLGIDTNKELIEQNRKNYPKDFFKQVNFLNGDALNFVKDSKNHGQFDLVLFQHPNFSGHFKDVFHQLFLEAENLLSEKGRIYSTIYYSSELLYFHKHVLPQMKTKSNTLLQNPFLKNNPKTSGRFQDRATGELFSPEFFTYYSEPRNDGSVLSESKPKPKPGS